MWFRRLGWLSRICAAEVYQKGWTKREGEMKKEDILSARLLMELEGPV